MHQFFIKFQIKCSLTFKKKRLMLSFCQGQHAKNEFLALDTFIFNIGKLSRHFNWFIKYKFISTSIFFDIMHDLNDIEHAI